MNSKSKKTCDDIISENDLKKCTTSKLCNAEDIRKIAKNYDIELLDEKQKNKSREKLCKDILKKKFGDTATVSTDDDDNINCKMTLSECNKISRDKLNKFSNKCGISNPLEYNKKPDLCKALIEKNKSTLNEDEKARLMKLENIKTKKEINKKIREDLESDSESDSDDNPDLETSDDDKDIIPLTDNIIRKELRNLGTYTEIVEKYKTKKNIKNALYDSLKNNYVNYKLDTTFNDHQIDVINSELKKLESEEYESESDIEDNKCKKLPPYSARSYPTREDLIKISKECGCKNEQGKPLTFPVRFTKKQVYDSIELCLKNNRQLKPQKEDEKEQEQLRLKQIEKEQEERLRLKQMEKEQEERLRLKQMEKEREESLRLKEMEKEREERLRLKELEKEPKERLKKKKVKSIEDLIVDSLHELGPYSKIIQKYADEDGDIDDLKFRKALKNNLKNKTDETILLKNYKKLINTTLADMEEEEIEGEIQATPDSDDEDKFLLEAEKEADERAMLEAEAEKQAMLEKEAEKQAMLESEKETDEEAEEQAMLEAEKESMEEPLSMEDDFPIKKELKKTPILERVLKSKLERRKKYLKNLPFKDIKNIISNAPDDLDDCDPYNNLFCFDNHTCDISQNKCIKDSDSDKLKNYDYEEFIYNNNKIIGPKNMVDDLKKRVNYPLQVEPEKAVETPLPLDLEKAVETPLPLDLEKAVETPLPLDLEKAVETPLPLDLEKIYKYVGFNFEDNELNKYLILINKNKGYIKLVYKYPMMANPEKTRLYIKGENFNDILNLINRKIIKSRNVDIDKIKKELKTYIKENGDNIYASVYLNKSNLSLVTSNDKNTLFSDPSISKSKDVLTNEYINNSDFDFDIDNVNVILNNKNELTFTFEKDVLSEKIEPGMEDEIEIKEKVVTYPDEEILITEKEDEKELIGEEIDVEDINDKLYKLANLTDKEVENEKIINTILNCTGLLG